MIAPPAPERHHRPSGPPRSSGRFPLLQLDPDLGRLLDAPRRAAARRSLTARVLAVDVGAWDLDGLRRINPANLGLLVINGVLAHESTLNAAVSTELLGPGDLVRPWALEGDTPLLPVRTCWNALSPLHVAVIDERLAGRMAAFPEITTVLVDRLNARARRLATLQAIAHLNRVDARVEAALWLLAERWGKVTPAGMAVDLALSHRALGQMVGASRQAVSTALGALARAGRVTRRLDGTWLLDPSSRPLSGVGTDGPVRQRRRLSPGDGQGPSDIALASPFRSAATLPPSVA